MKTDSIELMRDGGFSGRVIFPAEAEAHIDVADQDSLYSSLAVIPCQTHSLNVGVVSGERAVFPDTDALVTFTPNVTIGIRTADCVPILMYCKSPACVAAVHAGWRGTLGGIVEKVVDVMMEHGVRPDGIHAVFGPSISQANYEVDELLAERFSEAGFGEYVAHPDGPTARPHIDLQGVNVGRLSARGVRAENIKPNRDCTFGSVRDDGTPLYQSHRRSHGLPGRNLTVIQWIPES